MYLPAGPDKLAVYRENAFVPFLAEPEQELMAKRPELFSVKRFAPVGLWGKIFRVCQELLDTGPAAAGERIRNATMVGIVGPMVQFADKLPPYVKSTKSLSREARKLLGALLGTKDPTALLFENSLSGCRTRTVRGRESSRGRECEGVPGSYRKPPFPIKSIWIFVLKKTLVSETGIEYISDCYYLHGVKLMRIVEFFWN